MIGGRSPGVSLESMTIAKMKFLVLKPMALPCFEPLADLHGRAFTMTGALCLFSLYTARQSVTERDGEAPATRSGAPPPTTLLGRFRASGARQRETSWSA